MTDVMKNLLSALRSEYPAERYDIYTENIEQGFSPPCFSLRQLRADVTPYPAARYEIVQHFDVRFFPAGRRPRAQCRAVSDTLLLLLQCVGNLRASGVSWEITDDVLHFFVSYRQFVRVLPDNVPMGQLQLKQEK